MMLSFTKMHGLGNDFVVLNGLETPIALTKPQIQYLADRRFGVGCDQVLLIEKADKDDADILYRIFNADGNEVEHCGNGIRCVGVYLKRQGLAESDEISVDSLSGRLTIYVEDDDNVRVDMGVPMFEPEQIPINTPQHATELTLALSSGAVKIMTVSMGNPHAVIVVDDVDSAPVGELGREIQQHPLFPESVNVGFMQIIDRYRIRLRVNERGVGETLACGTGACGAVATGINTGILANDVEVELKGGVLRISWDGGQESMWMTGPATTVYEGHIEL